MMKSMGSEGWVVGLEVHWLFVGLLKNVVLKKERKRKSSLLSMWHVVCVWVSLCVCVNLLRK